MLGSSIPHVARLAKAEQAWKESGSGLSLSSSSRGSGVAVFHTVGATRSGALDGAVTIIVDVLLVLAQAGYSCPEPT